MDLPLIDKTITNINKINKTRVTAVFDITVTVPLSPKVVPLNHEHDDTKVLIAWLAVPFH